MALTPTNFVKSPSSTPFTAVTPSPSPTATLFPHIQFSARLGKGIVQTIAWSPSSQELAIATSLGIRLLNIPKLEEIAFIDTKTDILSLSYSPDGRLIASVDNYLYVNLWDRNTLKLHRTIGNFETYYAVSNLVFSPDGKWLAIALYEKIYLYEVEKEGIAYIWDFYPSNVTTHSVAFSSDGKLIAAAGTESSNESGQIIRVWETKTGNELYTFDNGVMDRVWALTFSPDNKTVIGGSNQYVRYWDVTDGRQTKVEFPLRLITAMSVDPLGDWLALSDDCGRMRIDSFHYSPEIIVQEECLSSFSETRTLAFSPNGKMLALSSHNNAVRLWARDDWQQPTIFDGRENTFYAPVFYPEGDRMQVINAKGELFDWHWGKDEITHSTDFECMAFSSSHRFCTREKTGEDKIIEVWDRLFSQMIFSFKRQHDLHAIDLNHNEEWLAVGERSNVSVWNIKDNRLVYTLTGHTDGVWDLAFNLDSTLLASAGGAHDNTVRIWNMTTGKLVRIVSGSGPIAFSPDGLLLTTGGWEKSEVNLWDIEKEEPLQTFQENGFVTAIGIKPGGSVIAIGKDSSDLSVNLWDIKSGKLLSTLAGGTIGISSLVFNFDGNILAGGGRDGAIYLWDVKNVQ